MTAGTNDRLLTLQSEILEAVAYGEPLVRIADLLCRRAEALAPGVICSILTVDRLGVLHPLAAPSLPDHYSRALEGLPIGASVGSCGTAAFLKQPVVVTDIATDPLWADFKGLALPLGLLACWSSPIKARNGNVVGTFAFYYRSSKAPEAIERRIVQTCVHLCAIAIEHEEVRARNHKLAYFDALTDLPNRTQFNELLDQRVAAKAPFGLLFLDIDHLKTVNDTLGHVVGDIFIKGVAERIATGEATMIGCRLGGDEFAILVDDCASGAALQVAAQSVLRRVNQLLQCGPHALMPHITVGGALFDRDAANAETLCQDADFALYHAKETHRGGFVQFHPGLRTSLMRRISMVRRVDLALAEDRILPYYQPIARIDSGKIVGLEALARMRTADGIVSAGEFQQAFADPKIAYQMTDRMLALVAADVCRWLTDGIAVGHVGINVTMGDFERGDLESRIVTAFEGMEVPLKHIILEVNEAVFMGGADGLVVKSVEALRRRGLLVALDDFGTGFASLTHLRSFPVDIIKIDKSFIDRVTTDRPSAVIVEGILDIARKLEMRVVAEGIETREQSDYLIDLGCVLGQGYHFARPCPAADATALLKSVTQAERWSSERADALSAGPFHRPAAAARRPEFAEG